MLATDLWTTRRAVENAENDHVFTCWNRLTGCQPIRASENVIIRADPTGGRHRGVDRV
jgi:hypothetical protein